MKKKSLFKLVAAVFILLIVFTFISKSVYSAKLPVVMMTSAGEKNVEYNLTVMGELYYENAVEITAPGSFAVAEVFAERGASVSRGEALFSLDISDAELEKASLDLELLRIDNTLVGLRQDMKSIEDAAILKSFEMRQQEYEAQRNILQRRIEKLTETYPADGMVRALSGGIVDRVMIEPGDRVQKGQACVEIHEDGAPLWVRYQLSGEDARIFQVPDNTRILVQTVTKNELTGSDTLAVETLFVRWRYNSFSDETGYLQSEIRLSEPEGTPVIKSGAQVIMLHGIFEPYRAVVPTSCLHRDGEGEYILVVQMRKTLFGIENYVTRNNIQVIARNDMYAAISGGVVNQVVLSSTQPLSDGDVVVVVR